MSGNDIKTQPGWKGVWGANSPPTPLTEVIIIIRNHSQSEEKKSRRSCVWLE